MRDRRQTGLPVALAGAGLAVLISVGARGATFSPQPGSAHVCADQQLSIGFGATPTLGSSGAIRLYDLTLGTLADEIVLGDATSAQRNFGGAVSDNGTLHLFNYFPVLIDGDNAIITFHRDLAYGHRYAVLIDPGVLTDADGFAGIVSETAWTFTVRPLAPPGGTASYRVAADGSADFCTVDGAIDAVPVGNTHPVTIDVAPGFYNEIDWVVQSKPFITVRGADRDRTVIQYANNDTLNAETGLTSDDDCPQRRIGGTHDLYNCWRGLFGVEASDFTLENITLHNTTPYGGSQAEAFRGNNARILLDRVTLLSFQDTLRIQTAGYVTDSVIAGDVDFTWGTGAAFFTRDELRALHAGFYAQVRNPQTNHGFVFLHDRLTADPTVPTGSVYLARIAATDYPWSEAVFIGDSLGDGVAPAGFQLDAPGDTCAEAPSIHFWGTRLTLPDGAPADTANALACAAMVPADLLSTYRDPRAILGGWEPATLNVRPAGQSAGPTPGPVAPGQAIAVDWSLAADGARTGAIVEYREQDGTPVPIDFRTVGDAALGTARFTAPRATGRYRFALFDGVGLAPSARSNVLHVSD